MDLPPVPKELTPEEYNIVDDFKKNSKYFDRFNTYTIKDGKAVVVVDALQERLNKCGSDEVFPLNILDLDDEDKESLTPSATEELANKKLYGKNEIMELLQCGNQKALNFLKLLFQMKYAIKVGKSYLVKSEDFDRFFDDFKGQEIVI